MKHYIAVIAEFNLTGQIIPLSIRLNNRRHEVDKVKYITTAASLKSGGQGLRYTCKINGRECYLFLEDNLWFIDQLDQE